MAKKGFRPVSLPACKQSVKSGVQAVPTTTLPPLTTQSCFVKLDNGSIQIVSPGQAAQ